VALTQGVVEPAEVLGPASGEDQLTVEQGRSAGERVVNGGSAGAGRSRWCCVLVGV